MAIIETNLQADHSRRTPSRGPDRTFWLWYHRWNPVRTSSTSYRKTSPGFPYQISRNRNSPCKSKSRRGSTRIQAFLVSLHQNSPSIGNVTSSNLVPSKRETEKALAKDFNSMQRDEIYIEMFLKELVFLWRG
jgi:hypothetical protein